MNHQPRTTQDPASAVSRYTLFALAALLIANLVSAQAAQAVKAATPPQQADYRVGSQDVLSITVWDQNDLSGKFAVETDGSFTFPLIGRVQVGGLTLRQVEEELKKRLSDGYFKNPQLTVAVDTYKSQRVFITGEVRTPGTYTLTGDMSLIEALARAGSTLPTAGAEVNIIHPEEGKAATGPISVGQANLANIERVDLRELQAGTFSKNIALRDGDTIWVPHAETIYVYGQVKNPGAYFVQTKDTTVMQALSLAGGVTDRGSTSRIKIVRIVRGQKTELKAKLTDLVLPGDTIMVAERFF
jgi:polysaccharide export outer membrane protein